MRLKSLWLGTVLALCGTGLAQAQTWSVTINNNPYAHVASNDGRTNLVVECVHGDFWLRHNLDPNTVRWERLSELVLRVDEQEFPMAIDGGSDYVLMSNVTTGNAIGITDDVIAALKQGSAVEIRNPHGESIALQSRSYGLRGSNAALTRLEANCVAPPPPAVFEDFLTVEQLKATIVGKRLRNKSLAYNSAVEFEFHPDGTYWTNGGSATGSSVGKYTLEDDGCIRWASAFGTTGCFKMRYDGGNLMVHASGGEASAIVEFL